MSAVRMTTPEAVKLLRQSATVLKMTENLPEWNIEDICNCLAAISENLRDIAYYVDELEDRIRYGRDQTYH